VTGGAAVGVHPAAALVELLFYDCDDCAIDVRLVEDRKGGDCRCTWYDGPADLLPRLHGVSTAAAREGRAVFVGVLPRVRRGDGSRRNLAPGWAAWADVDFCDTPEAELPARLAGLPSPSVVVRSGHGLHLYWLMQERTAPPVLEDLSRRLAARLGADHCFDAARVLRLPGTLNLKGGWGPSGFAVPPGAPVVRVARCDASRRYNPHDFDMLAAAVAPPPSAPRGAPRGARIDGVPPTVAALLARDAHLAETWGGRGRTSGDLSNSGYDLAVAGALCRLGIRDPDALDAAIRARPYAASVGKAARSDRSVRRVVDRALADDTAETAAHPPVSRDTDEPPPHGDDDAPPGRQDDPGPPPVEQGGDDHPTEHLTDLGNARRLVALHGADLRWCPTGAHGGWLCWDGARWAPDAARAVRARAKDVPPAVEREADGAALAATTEARAEGAGTDAAAKAGEEARGRVLRWARHSESAAALAAMVDLAATEPGVVTLADRFDADPWLLNTPSGTVDLRSGTSRLHARDDLLTRTAGAPYGHEGCPTWSRFIARVTGGDAALGDYLRRAAGYTLSGSTREQVFFILHGTGRNGKSTFIETIRHVMGQYARHLPASTFMRRHSEGVPNDLATLPGVRLVTATETPEGRGLDESLVKAVTGGDAIAARFMRAEWFEFVPVLKLWLSTNHKPDIRGTDEGIWRRVRLIPFGVTIPPGEVDPDLPMKLRGEGPGILRWMLDGFAAWLESGLVPPEAVARASLDYRSEMDRIGDYLDQRCARGPGEGPADNGDLYADYVRWCLDNGEHAMAQRSFSASLKDRGLVQDRPHGGQRRWRDLSLRQPTATPPHYPSWDRD
jgi:putative DNA primase/helicase